jgi:hypothetical protein
VVEIVTPGRVRPGPPARRDYSRSGVLPHVVTVPSKLSFRLHREFPASPSRRGLYQD